MEKQLRIVPFGSRSWHSSWEYQHLPKESSDEDKLIAAVGPAGLGEFLIRLWSFCVFLFVLACVRVALIVEGRRQGLGCPVGLGHLFLCWREEVIGLGTEVEQIARWRRGFRGWKCWLEKVSAR